jgi:hypothetical protein
MGAQSQVEGICWSCNFCTRHCHICSCLLNQTH